MVLARAFILATISLTISLPFRTDSFRALFAQGAKANEFPLPGGRPDLRAELAGVVLSKLRQFLQRHKNPGHYARLPQDHAADIGSSTRPPSFGRRGPELLRLPYHCRRQSRPRSDGPPHSRRFM